MIRRERGARGSALVLAVVTPRVRVDARRLLAVAAGQPGPVHRAERVAGSPFLLGGEVVFDLLYEERQLEERLATITLGLGVWL